MPVPGYKSISVREDIVQRLGRIGRLEGLRSIAEVIVHITEYYERHVLPWRKDPRIELVFKLLGIKGEPYKPIEGYFGHADYPIVFLTFIPTYQDEKLVIYPAITLNPTAILKSYCNKECEINELKEDLKRGLDYLHRKIKAFENRIREVNEILEVFGVAVSEKPKYIIIPFEK